MAYFADFHSNCMRGCSFYSLCIIDFTSVPTSKQVASGEFLRQARPLVANLRLRLWVLSWNNPTRGITKKVNTIVGRDADTTVPIIIHRITVFSKISGPCGYAWSLSISRTSSMFLHRSFGLFQRLFLPSAMVSLEVSGQKTLSLT